MGRLRRSRIGLFVETIHHVGHQDQYENGNRNDDDVREIVEAMNLTRDLRRSFLQAHLTRNGLPEPARRKGRHRTRRKRQPPRKGR